MIVVAVRFDPADVAGVEPAVANPLRRGVGPAKVTFHDMGPAGDDLAGVAERNFLVVVIDDLHFHARHGAADATHFRFGFFRLHQRDHRRGFG